MATPKTTQHPHTVSGHLRQTEGEPIPQQIVKAYHLGLGDRETLLGQTKTDAKGAYHIQYQPPAKIVNLLVRVYASADAQESLVSSTLVCKAKAKEVIDLTIGGEYKGPTELQRLSEVLVPILEAENLEASDLKARDVELLACNYDLDDEQVASYIAAVRLWKQSELPIPFFYGLIRSGMPASLATLVAQASDILQSALERSIEQNIISQKEAHNGPGHIERLKRLAIRLALEHPEPEVAGIGSILELAGIKAERKQKFVEAAYDHKGTVTEFWETLRKGKSYSTAELDKLQHLLRLSILGLNHLPLVEELAKQDSGTSDQRLRRLIRYTPEDWKRLLRKKNNGKAIGAPAFLSTDEGECIERFAVFLPRILEMSFPTATLTLHLKAHNSPQLRLAKTFLEKNPEFDFHKSRIKDYLVKHPEALDGLREKEETLKQVKGIERLFFLLPPYERASALVPLMEAKLHSSVSIRREGVVSFVRNHEKALGGRQRAEDIYNKAARRADTALMMYTRTKRFDPLVMNVVVPFFIDDIPDYEDLFGQLDFCQCAHCNSVFSPAAYLVDILHWLEKRRTDAGGNALDAFLARRPDIGNIDLNCKNTNTPLKYIDLVNEILENAIAGDLRSRFYQTTASAEELSANPEHSNPDAYDALSRVFYPWILPFNLWHAEAKVYLEHLGIKRYDLIRYFSRLPEPRFELQYAASYLGMLPQEGTLIGGNLSTLPERELWGFETQAAYQSLVTSRSVATILRQSGLTYEELDQYLKSGPFQAIEINFREDPCNIDEAVLANVNANFWNLFPRYVRLQHKLGWSIQELGLVMRLWNIQELNDEVLIDLSCLKQLHQTLNVPLDQLANWWVRQLDTEGETNIKALYTQVFLDATVNRPEVAIFNLNGLELANPHSRLADVAAEVHTALGMRANELTLLADFELSGGFAGTELNLQILTRLYQANALRKALKMSIKEYIALRRISGINPVGVYNLILERKNLRPAVRFADLWSFIKTSKFDLETLDYLLLQQLQPNSSIVADEKKLLAFFSSLLTGLTQIRVQNTLPAEADSNAISDLLKSKLALVLAADQVAEVMDILALKTPVEATSPAAASLGRWSEFIDNVLSQFLDPIACKAALLEDGAITNQDERNKVILLPLLAHLLQTESRLLVIQSCAAEMDLSPEMMQALLEGLLQLNNPATGTAENLLPRLLEASFTAGIPDEASPIAIQFPSQYLVYRKLEKVAISLHKLGIQDKKSLQQYVQATESMGWLNPDSLPLEGETPAADLFERWVKTEEIQRAIAPWSEGWTALFQLLANLQDTAVNRTTFLEKVSLLTQWGFADLDFLTSSSALNFAYPDDYTDGHFLARLAPCFSILNQLGVSGSEAWTWGRTNISRQTAQKIKLAARAKYELNSDWLAVAKPLRDTLRVQQRDALVAYLIGQGLATPIGQQRRRFSSKTDLYNQYLIDVEMDACMMTSRIKQAISSTQLFIQRGFLNLENLVLEEGDRIEWDWMKNNQLWMAARETFCYTENWIYPELRDNKTPFFKDLENGLLQDEVNAENVEREYLKYLRQLQGVAHLEICAIYNEQDNGEVITHVIGRTFSQPRLYYYRKWIDQRYWTPWEAVPLDIGEAGKHLVATVYNRRLYLIWPDFREKAKEEIPGEGQAQLPQRFLEIRLNWAELKDNKWSAKQISEDFLKVEYNNSRFPDDFSSLFKLITIINSETLEIEISTTTDEIKRAPVPSEPPNLPSPLLSLRVNRFVFTPCQNQVRKKSKDFKPIKTYSLFPGKRLGKSANFYTGDSALYLPTYEYPHLQRIFSNTSEKSYHLLFHHDDWQSRIFPLASFQDLKRVFVYTISKPDLNPATPAGIQDRIRMGTAQASRSRSNTSSFLAPTESAISRVSTAEYTIDNLLLLEAGENLNPPGEMMIPVFDFSGNLFPRSRAAAADEPVRAQPKPKAVYQFFPHYHPYVCILIEQLNRHGIEGILKPDPEKESSDKRKNFAKGLKRQLLKKDYFDAVYGPSNAVVKPYPADEFDFSYNGAYSVYNWELFFHTPFMIAKRLSENKRFAEAKTWYEYLFNPLYPYSISEIGIERFWQIKPFYQEQAKGITSFEKYMMLLGRRIGTLNSLEKERRNEIKQQIEDWRKTPFNTHALAFLRITPYMKTVVMGYLDNLIEWGDHLFRRDTIESINEATQLYLLAKEILGERPVKVNLGENVSRTLNGVEVSTFNQLRPHLDDFSNALVALEEQLIDDEIENPPNGGGSLLGGRGLFATTTRTTDLTPTDLTFVGADRDDAPDYPIRAQPMPPILGPSLFFCIPPNDKLLKYWDLVDDRLYKIRHCMNIQGVVRSLALFEPRIDPGQLVKAAAAGIDLSNVLNELNAPSMPYRYQVLQQKAAELINELKSLGGALLSALEKKDAEELAMLRSTLEIELLKTTRGMKETAIKEAKENLEGLKRSKEVIVERKNYYQNLDRRINEEKLQQRLVDTAMGFQTAQAVLEFIAGGLHLVPTADIGVAGAASTPTAKAKWGGRNVAASVQSFAGALGITSGILNSAASRVGTEASYKRRNQDWDFQRDVANKELAQIEKQISAAEIRIAITEKDLDSHDKQIENAQRTDEYMRSKYTNQELYNWMSTQIAGVYFQTYQMAYDMAKKAERAFQFELGVKDTNYIQYGYWDNLRKGLLSGEKLHKDLHRLEIAYLEQNKRELEITKHVSLAMLNPEAVLTLQETGVCEFELPEVIFDLDFAGHFDRRTKSVSISIPCVTGPYTSISAKLTLLSSRIRKTTATSEGYAFNPDEDYASDRFAINPVGIQSIATSTAQNDSGMFELNFRDERYLPFEYSGVISRWRLELPTAYHQFDYNTISDVIMHMKYTAKDGGGLFKQQVEEHVQSALNRILDELAESETGMARVFSLKKEFPNELYELLENHATTLVIEPRHFPYILNGRELSLQEFHVILKPKQGQEVPVGIELTINEEANNNFNPGANVGDSIRMASYGVFAGSSPTEQVWELSVDEDNPLSGEVIEDVMVVMGYTVG